MPLLRELIEIPEKVQSGDFVLNLSTGLEPAAIKQTLDQYVVTPQLVGAVSPGAPPEIGPVASGNNGIKLDASGR